MRASASGTAWPRVLVDVEDTARNRQFFVRLKDRLKSRFQQKDIWLTTYPIEVI